MSLRLRLIGQLAASFFLFAMGNSAFAATFSPGDVASLRDALSIAATNGQDDTIDLGGQTLILQQALVFTPEDKLLTITNGTLERMEGDGPTRLVEIKRAPLPIRMDFGSNAVIFDNVTFKNGLVDVGNDGPNDSGGGAILGDWSLRIENSRFENNRVIGNGAGGAILSSGMLTVTDSDFIRNSALSSSQSPPPGSTVRPEGLGGAIIIKQQAFRLENNTYTQNQANKGGALYFSTSSTNTSFILQSFFDRNESTTRGGAIWSNKNSLIVENSTLIGNSASTGGGAVYSQSQGATVGDAGVSYGIQIRFSALLNNTAGGSGGGGVLGFFSSDLGVSLLSNLFGNNTADNCGVINGRNQGFNGNFSDNISDDSSCGNTGVTTVGDIFSLFSGELRNNGGRSPTFALALDSIAVDASTGSFCPLSDQRGVRRPSGGNTDANLGERCDIGPYELDLNDFDTDEDGVSDFVDNCPAISNPDQADTDGDGIGDLCDPDTDNDGVDDATDNCPVTPNSGQEDTDGDDIGDACDLDIDNDGVSNERDNCPVDVNREQENTDGDALGDVCDPDLDNDGVDNTDDNCPAIVNPDQEDGDGDGTGDACEDDTDNDGVVDDLDNCPAIANPDQEDADGDGTGDICDNDADNDGVIDADDNCPAISNSGQEDADGDGTGDVCENDTDNDGVVDDLDNCPAIANPDQEDVDGDGTGDVCDNDADNDGVIDADDNCPAISNSGQEDADGDGTGDACENDTDNDGVVDDLDNCPAIANPGQEDADGDGTGDICDNDADNDGVIDADDNCPAISNPGQEDADGDGEGDVCDSTPNGDDSGEEGIKTQIEQAASDLDDIIATTHGGVSRILRRSARQLDRALNDRNFDTENTLSKRRGINVFTRIGNALNDIERIADNRRINGQLRSNLDEVSNQLLDSMRTLAQDRLSAAIEAHGSRWRIGRSQEALRAADYYRDRDLLRRAANTYGFAWRQASLAIQ